MPWEAEKTETEAIEEVWPLAQQRGRDMVERLQHDAVFEGVTLVDFFATMWLQGIRDAERALR